MNNYLNQPMTRKDYLVICLVSVPIAVLGTAWAYYGDDITEWCGEKIARLKERRNK